jgi:hypothetical protein
MDISFVHQLAGVSFSSRVVSCPLHAATSPTRPWLPSNCVEKGSASQLHVSAISSSNRDHGTPQSASSMPSPPASPPFGLAQSSSSALLRSPAAVFALPVAVAALAHRFVKDLAPGRATDRLLNRTTEILNDRRARQRLRAVSTELLLAESAAATTAAAILGTEGLLDIAVAQANELESQVDDLAAGVRSVDHAVNLAVEKESKSIAVERELKVEQTVTVQAREELTEASETLGQNYNLLSKLEKTIIDLKKTLQLAEDHAENELHQMLADKEQKAIHFEALKRDLDSVLEANKEAQAMISQSVEKDVQQMQSRLQIALEGLEVAGAKSEDSSALGTNDSQEGIEIYKRDLQKVEFEMDRLQGYITQLDDDAIVVQRLRTELDSREKALDEVRGRLEDVNKNGMIERPLEFDISSRLSVSAPSLLDNTATTRHALENSQLKPSPAVKDDPSSPSTDSVEVKDDEAHEMANRGDRKLVHTVASQAEKSDSTISIISPVEDHQQLPSATRQTSRHPKQRKKMTAITEILALAAQESDKRGGKTSAEAATAQALKALKADDGLQSGPAGLARGRPERLSGDI